MNLIKTNQRLREISLELYALRDHLQLVEKHIEHYKKIEKRRFDNLIKKRGLSIDDPGMQDAKYDYDYRIEFLLPRFLRAPFLVSLYAVYESAVTDVASMMKEKQSQFISMNDLQGNLLEKAVKYYNHILKFDLCVNARDFDRIKMLIELRHALAHTNGRIQMLKQKNRNKILAWESQKIGLSFRHGYIIIETELAENLFESVRSTLNNLIVRYKKWKN